MTTRERVAQLIKIWPKVYPNAHTELDFRNPLQLLVATILSAQSTDKRVNMVTPALFTKYRTARDYADAPNRRETWRQSPRHHGGVMRVAGRRPQNGECGSGQRFSQKRRHRRGYARHSSLSAAWPDKT